MPYYIQLSYFGPADSSLDDPDRVHSTAISFLYRLKEEYEAFPNSPNREWLQQKIRYYEALLMSLGNETYAMRTEEKTKRVRIRMR